jgi:hypothetical protein
MDREFGYALSLIMVKARTARLLVTARGLSKIWLGVFKLA